MRKLYILILALSLLTMITCADKVDVEADKEANIILIEKVVRDINAGDVEGLLTYYTSNGIWMPPNAPSVEGIKTLRMVFQGMWDQVIIENFKAQQQDIIISGDYAMARGINSWDETQKTGGETVYKSGNWVAIRQRQPDGSWKTIWDCLSSNVPLPDSK